MNIKFTNGKTIEYLNAVISEEYANGASRSVITFECDPTTGVDEINAIVSDENNVATITLTGDDGIQSIHDGYILKLKVGLESVPQYTEDGPQYAERLVFKLGKMTYIEQKIKQISGQVDRLEAQAFYTGMMTDTLI